MLRLSRLLSADLSVVVSLCILSAIVLSVSGCVLAGRPRLSASAEARTTILPQADVRTDELRRAIACGRALHSQFPTGVENCRTFRCLSSPAQHRPATPAPKKSPVSAVPPPLPPRTAGSSARTKNFALRPSQDGGATRTRADAYTRVPVLYVSVKTASRFGLSITGAGLSRCISFDCRSSQ